MQVKRGQEALTTYNKQNWDEGASDGEASRTLDCWRPSESKPDWCEKKKSCSVYACRFKFIDLQSDCIVICRFGELPHQLHNVEDQD